MEPDGLILDTQFSIFPSAFFVLFFCFLPWFALWYYLKPHLLNARCSFRVAYLLVWRTGIMDVFSSVTRMLCDKLQNLRGRQ